MEVETEGRKNRDLEIVGLDEDVTEIAIIEGIVGYSDPMDLDRGIITEEVRKNVEEDLRVIGEELGDPSVVPINHYRTTPIEMRRSEGFTTALQQRKREQEPLELPAEMWIHISEQLIHQEAYQSLSSLQIAGVPTTTIHPDIIGQTRIERLRRRLLDTQGSLRTQQGKRSTPSLVELKKMAISDALCAKPKFIPKWEQLSGINWHTLKRVKLYENTDEDTEFMRRYMEINRVGEYTIEYTGLLSIENRYEFNIYTVPSTSPSTYVGNVTITITPDEEQIDARIHSSRWDTRSIEERVHDAVVRQLQSLLRLALPELYE